MFTKTLLLTATLVGFAFATSGETPAVEAAAPVPSEGSVLVPSPAVEGENAPVAEHAAKKEEKAEKKKKGGKKHKAGKAHKAGKHHKRHAGKHHKHHGHCAGDKITDELNKSSVDKKAMPAAPAEGMPKAENMNEKAVADTQKSIVEAKKEVNEVKEAVVS